MLVFQASLSVQPQIMCWERDTCVRGVVLQQLVKEGCFQE